MRSKKNFFQPNTVIYIGMDFKENKLYMIDVTTRKIYSHPNYVRIACNFT